MRKNKGYGTLKLMILIAVTLSLIQIAFAIPNSLTLQGKLTNTGGSSQVGTFNFTFKIYDSFTGGNVLWELADYNITTDANGIYDVILKNINLSFADQYYLGITVRSDNESTPRINLTAAPYSFRANTSEALNPNASYSITNLSVSGNATFGSDTTTVLRVDGILNATSNTIIGDTSTDTIAVNAQFTTNLIPNQNNIDLGSATNFWRRAYIDLATISNLSVTGNTSLGGTISPTFILNSNYSGDDARDVELIFERGTPTTNAVIFWDSTNKRFDMNFPLFIQANQNLTVDTNTLFVDGSINKVGIGKLNPATELDVAGGINASTLNVSGNVYLATLSGNVGIGTTNPTEKLVVAGNANVTGNLTVGNIANLQSSSSTPRLLSNFSLGAGSDPRCIDVASRYAYVGTSGTSDIQIIDVSNPSSPELVSKFSVSGSNVVCVRVSGRYAYVAQDTGGNKLEIIDISNASSPVSLGSVSISRAFDVMVQGRYAYVAGIGADTIYVVDVSNPRSPAIVGNVSVGGNFDPGLIYVQGRYAYTTTGNSANAFKIIDVSEPTNPTIEDTFDPGNNLGSARRITVSGRYAYVSNANSDNFQIIDVSNSTNSTLVANLTVGTGPTPVYVTGRYAYVGLTSNRIQIIDVSNASAPFIANTINLTTNVGDLYVSGRYLYAISTGDDNLMIYDITGTETTSLNAHSLEAGYLSVRTNAKIDNLLQVGGGINVGSGGIFSDGSIGTRNELYVGSKVGINTTNPAQTLTVVGTLNVTSGSGTQGLFQDSSGNVGIGTTAPTALLNVHVASGSTPALNITNIGTGNTTIINDEAGDTTPFIIDNAGNVGIGTTGPINKLHVLASSVIATNIVSIESAQPSIRLIDDESPQSAWSIFGDTNFRIDQHTFANRYVSTTGTNRFAIVEDGNVGIGTTTAGSVLTVSGNFSTTTGALLATSSGNVGIGTTNPSSLLQVAGTANITSSSTQFLVNTNGDVVVNLKG